MGLAGAAGATGAGGRNGGRGRSGQLWAISEPAHVDGGAPGAILHSGPDILHRIVAVVVYAERLRRDVVPSATGRWRLHSSREHKQPVSVFNDQLSSSSSWSWQRVLPADETDWGLVDYLAGFAIREVSLGHLDLSTNTGLLTCGSFGSNLRTYVVELFRALG